MQHERDDRDMLDCGHEPSPHNVHTTGYGEDADGKRYCYACCGEREREDMKASGRAFLYLAGPETAPYVTDWPGTFKLPVLAMKRGRHNVAGVRTDVWFIFNGQRWHGTRMGDNGTYVRCRRIASRGTWRFPFGAKRYTLHG